MTSDTILDSGLYVRGDLGATDKYNLDFTADLANAGRIASQLLLYNQIAIPTLDYGIVPALYRWLGLPLLREVLESRALRFVRRHPLGYGGSLGIAAFGMKLGSEYPWWAHAMFAELDIALSLQIENRCEELSGADRSALLKSVIQNSVEFYPSNELFVPFVMHESYRDIIESPQLVAKLQECLPGTTIDLERLPTVAANAIRISSDEPVHGDPAGIILEVAELNMDLLAADHIGGADFVSSADASWILRGKIGRCIPGTDAVNGFMKTLKILRIPDVQSAIASGQYSFSDIWKLRQGERSVKFRRWLRNAKFIDEDSFLSEYVSMLEGRPNSLNEKSVRFGITTAAGALNPVAGLVASAVDSFFVDRWLNGYTPRIFFDDLRKLSLRRRDA